MSNRQGIVIYHNENKAILVRLILGAG